MGQNKKSNSLKGEITAMDEEIDEKATCIIRWTKYGVDKQNQTHSLGVCFCLVKPSLCLGATGVRVKRKTEKDFQKGQTEKHIKTPRVCACVGNPEADLSEHKT